MKQHTAGKSWIVGIWAINAIVVMTTGIALLVFWEQTPFAKEVSIPTPMVLATLPPTFTPNPATCTTTPTPSQIPSPSATFPSTSTSTVRPSITPYIHITDTSTPLPWMAGPITVGYSVNARPLEVYRFGTGAITRLIIAGIHGGGEWNTISLADELINYVTENHHVIPADVTLYILRNMNPDGDARAHGPEGRVNDHGVDLNRNFPAGWKADWDRDGCWILLPTTSGSFGGSEPETVAVMIFVQQHKVDAVISYHSAALGIFPGGLPPDPDSVDLAETVAAVSLYPYPPIDTGCEYTGTLADWASEKGIAAVDVELTNHTDTDFYINLEVLKAFLEWRR